ncbi:MAG TPA: SDR family oxidoreductase [Ktedonobacterales bacterium]|nr:SDR family oxidoreductase [Ktedonobacterales bacterium]
MNQDQQMRGKVCIVTGATSGIGKATALGLARQQATVALVARNRAKGEAVRQEIQSATGNQNVDVLLADLSSQASIRQLAGDITERYPQVHVLVNNAGVFMLKRRETVDGLEMTFAVNHLAPLLLTQLLLEKLRASAPARIVNVCSGAHTTGHINWQDLQLQQRYGVWRAYAQSKLAMLLCSYELAHRLEGEAVTVNCVHPGFVFTNMGMNNVGPRTQALAKLVLARLGTSPEKGARTSIYLATSPEVEHISGRYFVNCKPTASSPRSYDEAAQRRLWEESARLVHLPDALSATKK